MITLSIDGATKAQSQFIVYTKEIEVTQRTAKSHLDLNK